MTTSHDSTGLIVNYASGGFLTDQKRLQSVCERLHQDLLCFSPPSDNFTPHSEYPYYFKIDALQIAAERSKLLLWLDASILPTGKTLSPIFEHIKREGHLLIWYGWRNSEWCNDKSLADFGFSRDEAAEQQQVMGGCFGLDLESPTGKLIWDQTVAHKESFKGKWTNTDRSESNDLRCLGHRHDQSVLALIAAKHKLKITNHEDNNWICYDANDHYLLNVVRA